MKNLILFSAVTFCLISCTEKVKDLEEPQETPEQVKSLVIGDPLDCGLKDKLMFPIGTSYHPEVTDAPVVLDGLGRTLNGSLNFSKNTTGYFYDQMASTEYINENDGDFDITNILFYDIETGKSYPLVGDEDTLHILSFAIHKEFENPLIFYRVVKEDYNCDTAFNSLDPVALYVSPLAGDTMIQVTPDHEQFDDYFYYKEHQKILVKTRIDSDNDSLFSYLDETNFVQMELNKPAFGKPLFSAELKADLKGKLNK